MNSIQEMLDKGYELYPAIMEGFEEFQMVDRDNDKLLCLELYKIINRREIIEMFCRDGIPFVECLKPLYPDFLSDLLEKIEDNGFFIHSADQDSRQVILVTDYYRPQSYENIIIYFHGFDVKIKYVTPLNYEVLKKGEDKVLEEVNHVIYFKRIIYDAIENKASDVHFTNNQNRFNSYDYAIKYRILNDYVPQTRFKTTKGLNDKIILEVISNYTVAESADLDTSYGVETSWLNIMRDNTADLRITGSSTAGGYTLVVRIQRMATLGKNVSTLGFDEKTSEALSRLSKRNTGLTLITGAVRTGKNTTMVAMINEQVKRPLKLVEYSSPIETILPYEQRDYDSSAETLLNFVKLAKKQDVDLAILNELPDKRLAYPVIDLVNSSIGVWTTFHINRIWNVCLKLKSYFGEDYIDLLTQVNGVVNQKMFVKLCPHCSVDVSHRNLSEFALNLLDDYGVKTFKEGKGCIQCQGTGRSRVVQPYAEHLIFSTELKEKLVRCSKPHEMETIIKTECYLKKTNMEVAIINAIKKGDLHPSDLDILE